MNKQILSVRGLIMFYNTQTKMYYIIGSDTEEEFENPLECWNEYRDKLDEIMKKRIGDALEKEGRDRYTGAYQQTFDL